MNITYTLKDKLEDMVGDVDVISDWDDNKFSLLINQGCKDLINRLRMINPNKLWDFSSEFICTSSVNQYSVQVGYGEATDGDDGLTDIVRTQSGSMAVDSSTMTANNNTAGLLEVGDYVTIATASTLADAPRNYFEIMQITAIAVGGLNHTVTRGMFGSKSRKYVNGQNIYKVTHINEILDVLNVRRREYYTSTPGEGTAGTTYHDHVAVEAVGAANAALRRNKTNLNSFLKTNEKFPVFTREGKKINIYPEVDDVAFGTTATGTSYMCIDAITVPWKSATLSQPYLDNIKLEYQDMILLWVALDVLRNKIKEEEANITSYNEIPTISDPTLSAPTGSITGYSFTESFNMSSVSPILSLDADLGLTAPTFVPAIMETIADPVITDLSINSIAPTAPSDVALSLTGASVSLPNFTNTEYTPESLSLDASPTYDDVVLPMPPTISISVADISDYIEDGDLVIPSDLTLESLVVGTAPTLGAPVLPDSPDIGLISETLPSDANVNKLVDLALNAVPVPDIGTIDVLSSLDHLLPPSQLNISDMSYSSIGATPTSPAAQSFPAPPSVPQMESLPSAPNIETDFGDVTHEVSGTSVHFGNISTPDLGTPPNFDDYSIDQTFTASWSSFSPSGVTSEWGHDLLDESGTSVADKPWSFEHALQVEEDPEVADLRLKQMAVEIDRWKSKNEVLARAFEAEMSGYVEGIRAQVAKIQGEGEIASASAKTAIASVEADKAVIDGQVASIQGKAAAQKAKSDAYLAEVNAKVAAFDGQASALTKIYVAQVQGLAQQYSVEAEFNVQEFSQAFQSQVALFKANVEKEIQQYVHAITAYAQEYQYALRRWELLEFKGKVEKWSIENQIKLSKYQAEVSTALQEYATDIAKHEKKLTIEIQRYTSEVSKVNSKYQLDLQQYANESNVIIQKYVAERDFELSKWRDKSNLDIQKHNVKFQMLIQDWTARIGALAQQKQLSITAKSGKSQADVAQFGARLQKQSTDYGLQLQKYTGEVQAQIGKHQSENNLKYQSWVNSQNQKIGKYQADVGQKVQEFQAKIQQEGSRFNLELQKFGAELQRHSAVVQTDNQEFQSNLAKYQASIQEYGANIQKEVNEYSTNLSHTLQIWNTNKQSNLQEYQGRIASQNTKVQSEMQVYINAIQTKIAEFNAQTNSDTQRYHAHVREEAGRYQLLMQNAVQSFQASVQEYSTVNQVLFQSNQERLAKYQANIQKLQIDISQHLQSKALDMQDIQARIQIHTTQYQMLAERYERSFIPYQPQGQQQQQIEQGG